jgi:predicted amidohydrolase YtcJ
MRADLIITNGRVRTMEPGASSGEAIAIAGDKIVAVGGNEEITGLAGPRTEQISAGGCTVMPGIVDAHNHVRLGANEAAVSLAGAASLDEVRGRIAGHVRAHPGTGWIEGDGWNYAAIPGGRPTASMIDGVCAGRPAWLFSYDVHTVWLNTEAMRRWGVSASRPELPFGTAELDPVTGQPTGWVHDFATKGIHPRAERALARVLPGYHPDAQYRRLRQNLRDAVRLGITTIVEPQNGLDEMALFSRARTAGELRSRLVAAIFYPPDSSPELLADIAAAKAEFDDDRLRVGPVKLYIDDVIEPHTAAMLAPYANAPGTGSLYWLPEEFAQLLVRVEEHGLQAFVHATGDRGIKTVLDGVQAARRAKGPRDARHQVVHVECLDPADIPRFRELGVVACMQPRHCAPDLVTEWRVNVGPARERYAWAMRSLADAGARLAFSSDWNVAEMDPMIGIYTALTRADLDGHGAWNTAETLDLDTTLQAYTYGGAYANFAERSRGTLRAGKLADVIVLSEDLHQIPEERILRATVTHTIVSGQIVHRTA